MKRLVTLAALLGLAGTALATANIATNEVLVLTTSTRVDTGTLVARRGIEVQNLGPNAIYCALYESTAAVVLKARKVAAGSSWAVDAPAGLPMYCIAATANQVTTAATIVTELN